MQEPTVCCTQAMSLACNVSHRKPTDDSLRSPGVCFLPKAHAFQESTPVTFPQRNQLANRNPSPLQNVQEEGETHDCTLLV